MTVFFKTAETLTAGAKTLPGYYYRSADLFQAEIERIFYRRWLCVGREAQIPEPGDYFLQQVGPENIIIVRDQQGRVRAYYNVCRHRGSRMCTTEAGRFPKAIQCPYHAWTYGLDGRLIGAPHMAEVRDFDKADYPLHPVATASWEGFILINLAEQPEPFEHAYAPLLGKFAGWRLPELQTVHQISYDVQANWKLLFQNYSECYHCPPVHPELSKLSHYTSGRNDLIEGPFLGGFMDIDHEGGSLSMSGRACAAPIAGISQENLQRVYYYTLFPNMFLTLHPEYVTAHLLWPQSYDRTLNSCSWFFHPEAMKRPDFRPDEAVDFWDMINREDWHVSELTQLGVSSKAYGPSPYSQQESLLAAFDREVLRALEHDLG
jgi:Rieske 2Fe-2S family protein